MIVAGYDGGTGAAPLTSLKHTGQPWELGLAETQQTLRLNQLREQVRVQVDGGLKTARDVIVAALLGAEEFGFSTAPLVVAGCVMMRVCHLDTCPVGIATQNPVLRERYTGTPEFVETFFLYLAEQVREYLAALGFRSIDEAVGHAEMLDVSAAVAHHRARGLDLAPLLEIPEVASDYSCTHPAQHDLSKTLDAKLIKLAEPALQDARGVRIDLPIRNVDRTAGTMLGSEVTRVFGPDGLPDAHHRRQPDRHRRPVARRVPAARGVDHPARRRQRLRRQGPLRRPDRGPAGRELAVPGARGEDPGDRRQHHRLRRHLR